MELKKLAKSKGGAMMFRAYFWRRHLLALERGDNKKADFYLQQFNQIKMPD